MSHLTMELASHCLTILGLALFDIQSRGLIQLALNINQLSQVIITTFEGSFLLKHVCPQEELMYLSGT